jgi:hypothetical protein
MLVLVTWLDWQLPLLQLWVCQGMVARQQLPSSRLSSKLQQPC